MKNGKVCALLTALCVAAALCGCRRGAEENRKPRVAVIVKSTESAFFKSVLAGATAASTEYNVDMTFHGPGSEEDYQTQNEMIGQAVEDGADAIVFSAVDYNANADAIEAAAKEGVKIVVIDSDVNVDQVSCRIGTDNYEAGRMAGEAALKTEAEELAVCIVNYDIHTANGQEREQGFRDYVAQDERVKSVETINVLSTTEDAREKTRAFLEENPGTNVIATFNEWTSLGVGWAVRDMGVKDSTWVVAFDSNAVSVGMLESGEVDALIVQNPYAMGYLGVETASGLINGKKPEARISTSTAMVDRDGLYSEEHQRLLFPFNQ